mmetsp:Transcript_9925/g.27134  ORF Transcript_9925/g.27134 Transcript_9925/m.27134 type:complete len:109 (+) Transcript_9925:2349-2675(+)
MGPGGEVAVVVAAAESLPFASNGEMMSANDVIVRCDAVEVVVTMNAFDEDGIIIIITVDAIESLFMVMVMVMVVIVIVIVLCGVLSTNAVGNFGVSEAERSEWNVEVG